MPVVDDDQPSGLMMKVGFIGLGHHWAWPHGHNRTPAKTETLIVQDAKAAGSIAETERRVSSPVLAHARIIFG